MADKPSDLIARARKDWKKAADAEETQRKAILEAKRFRAGDQWPAQIRLAREGAAAISGQPPQPARPCLTIDRLSPPARRISNQIKNADFGFNVLPNGRGADIETAEILKGYLRRMQNASRAESPIEWAADGAVEGGLGWLELKTEYAHQSWDGDPSDPEAYDQELCLGRIPNSLSVYCDPSSMHPTRRDALFMFIVWDMDRDAYTDQYGKDDAQGLEDFQTTGDLPGWVSDDKIRLAKYWRVEFETKHIWATEYGQSGEGDPPKGVKPAFEREVRKPIVKGSLINAVRELKPFAWVGRRIPVFPILGEELNVDGKCVLRGVIQPGMDAQRMVNFTYSAAVEIFALAPKKAPRVAAASIANYKQTWDTRNIYNWSYHPYDPWDDQGRALPPPQDDQSEAPIQAAVALMQVSEEGIKASTSTGDASLGNTNPNERSGRALEALKVESDLANGNYASNTERTLIDIADEAVYVIPKITRPGQIVHILGMDDEPEQVMFGKPFEKGPNGEPVPAPPNVTPEMAKLKDNLFKFYDPSAGRYAVTVTVGKAQATRQQEGSAALGELIPHLPPEMAAAVTPDYIEQLSFPGAQKITETLRKALPPNLRGGDEAQQQQSPEMLAQQITQLQTQLQELQPLADDNQAKMRVEEMKQFAEHDREKMRIDADLEKARMDNATRIEVARIGAEKQISSDLIKAREERLATGLELTAEDLAREHEVGMAAMDAATSADAAERDRMHASEQADADRNAARESQTQAERAAEKQAARTAAKKEL